ncbi:glycine--tRNA ligase subunit beta [Pukyongiella litopenaei]|uniref:Glycine--tRNA ligase beta subunit n=1 Tax=Pukyongiella litopenaei TaxID=2605946 RepID=A0A2S0MS47_9RHOB|nr:glycine--tRNA ligase subunit beta [Pukyongiella litopenaei]AVO38719.1 glycine--tRNA ligase subunit beta [Pukyongiella litopenaei]
MPDLLIELFSEEIPARMQARAGEDLKKRMTDGLVEAGLTYAGAAAFATPRRLTLTVQGLPTESPTIREERKGPRVGAPDKAVDGFLRGAGIPREALEQRDTPKGAVWFATVEKPGHAAEQIVAEVLETVIRGFPWPKSMRWGDGSLRWVRPLQSILCILTDESGARVVPMEVGGIAAGDSTEGHRFMAPGRFSVTSFEDYETRLRAARVILSSETRAEQIRAEAGNLAFAAGMELVEDAGLLAEVAGLVEWPVVLMGDIAEDFLSLPPEVLQTSMREHQKFFSLRNPKTGRIEKFITVANRETADNGATILSGNRKVLFARLSDAKFFWENDLRVAGTGGQAWLDALENVTFHNRLGSQGDRIRRIAALARELAPACGADPDMAERAARWAKADLSSEMVYEFPELQGLMGRYYAGHAGHPAEVAAAAQDHYSPLGPSDTVPTAPVSVAVALADKLDTLTGFWAIDEKPTGSKDPFALRRAALGVIRLVLENDLKLPLLGWLTARIAVFLGYDESHVHELNRILVEYSDILRLDESGSFSAPNQELMERLAALLQIDREARRDEILAAGRVIYDQLNNARGIGRHLLAFLHDRLKVFLRDEGIRHDIIDACISMPGSDDLNLLVKRARALQAVLGTEDGENLVQGFKRTNLLNQAKEKYGDDYSLGADVKLAETDSETALFAALDEAEARIAPALEAEDFPAAMAAMAALRAPIDAFFKDVQVMSDNDEVRRNRLRLLHRIRATCAQVADLTRIE